MSCMYFLEIKFKCNHMAFLINVKMGIKLVNSEHQKLSIDI